ncbi:hypothetical protein CPB84DRAFT_1538187 [Gymnopilus junonius]|uniref:Uncharacterized protein n=1 Tax=Gymnopilus junonius TaxID=109634 RepID=A0A9P5NJA8_GYMJU|nr:hypothetical protein CPB84DRAFT_1538187 [Gymnopilus junonius]
MRRRREGNDNSNVMRNVVLKEEEEPIRVRRIKGEPIHIDLSRDDDQWSPSDSVGGGKDKRRFYVDLTLEANEPPHRIAFVLPSRSTDSAPRQAISGPSSSRSAPVTAPTARDRHRGGIPALDDDLDRMYLDPSGEANAGPYQMPALTQEVHTSNHVVIPSKDGSSSSQEKVEPEPGTTMFDPPHGSEKRSRS